MRGHVFDGRKYPCDKAKVAAVVRQMLFTKAKNFHREGLKVYSRMIVTNANFYERGLRGEAQCMKQLTLQATHRNLKHMMSVVDASPPQTTTDDISRSYMMAWDNSDRSVLTCGEDDSTRSTSESLRLGAGESVSHTVN